MRRPSLLFPAAAAIVACSGGEPTSIRPEFAADCSSSASNGSAASTLAPSPARAPEAENVSLHQAGVPTGIPFGMNGLTPDTIQGAGVRWTETTLLDIDMRDALRQLAAAKAKNIRMWLILTVGNEESFFVSSRDHRFCVARWDSIFDAHVAPHGANVDGT